MPRVRESFGRSSVMARSVNPHAGRAAFRAGKCPRRDADDAKRDAVETHGAADDVRIAAELDGARDPRSGRRPEVARRARPLPAGSRGRAPCGPVSR